MKYLSTTDFVKKMVACYGSKESALKALKSDLKRHQDHPRLKKNTEDIQMLEDAILNLEGKAGPGG